MKLFKVVALTAVLIMVGCAIGVKNDRFTSGSSQRGGLYDGRPVRQTRVMVKG